MARALAVLLGLLVLHSASAFDFYYLSLEWPGSYCDRSEACCYPTSGKPASDFSIHGLWPDNINGDHPENCDTSDEFDPSEISDLRRDMNRLWGSLSCPSSNSEEFWAHEWEKHGTCSGLSQHEYFATTIQFRKAVDPLAALAAAGIVPRNGRMYNVSSIRTALENGLGYRVAVTCNRDADRDNQIYEIYLCISKDASQIIDCPVLPQNSCARRVEFPEFGSSEAES